MGKVKWDSNADQTLLAKILETHDLSVDAARVAEAWPAQDDDHKPTPRAIKERLTRIKENVRQGNPAGAGPSSPVTPKKRTPRKKANETPTSATPSRKRKRVTKDTVVNEDQVDVNEEEDLPTEHTEIIAESAINKETGLDEIDPLLHPQVEQEYPVVDHGKNDPEWSGYNSDADWDSDELSK
ncbi:hypothetical protein LT330_006640 [Penicillium expansum]|uniref:Uncharacterized protein n=1 Tax=Penicillium expansum TaxID=27334 RepID=A0A0A2JGJ9_PENEN|nr:hypothetical protein PEX2_018340 [Penicillium expansum]KAK4867807.1 hypothetical protein LT330_001317 [Penicillium expansum]KAK4869031.1 hypothetical protein LT330_006640 [Penicillium expansum]KGO46805.1 hypothetical protein PEXP_064950 [Penicillium expansum]KGO54494.1 hypothetical protein PEX1_076790 [Penicillium expansum]KGO62427.1 hypothetical protein PEX2_018340 [Penicillium expansum]